MPTGSKPTFSVFRVRGNSASPCGTSGRRAPPSACARNSSWGRIARAIVIIPPGVVHGYRNLSDRPGLVCNFANRLYRGPGRCEPVDEIRFEDAPDSPFRLE